MSHTEASDQDAIRRIVHGINEAWRRGRYDDIGTYLADDAVIAPPGIDRRIRGREPYVQSYRHYDQAATTHEFSAGEPQVDVVGDVAVAVCPFVVVYELQGKTYREKGRDLLVFSRPSGEWKVIWRTMQTEPAE